MKKRLALLSILVGFMVSLNVAEARPKRHSDPIFCPKAPEISVASGASAIALLTGVLLLVGERTRTRRS